MADAPSRRGKDFWRVDLEVRAQRQQSGRILREIVKERGDPWLTAWEEQFLASMREILRRTGGEIELSEKQCLAVMQIEDKLRSPMPADVGDPPEDG